MPVYQCYSPKGLLTKSAKAEIAEEITSIYCKNTGSSASWVHVLFHEIPAGECFVAGKPATKSYILAINRHGRDLEARQAMLRQFTQMWTRITGQSEVDLWVSLIEIDPTNLMEAGLFFPEPSHEPEWIEENHARLAELGLTVP
jgi:phenylpyruvate tautomerase PptA (4-oxalocrotonate tautomerase family)